MKRQTRWARYTAAAVSPLPDAPPPLTEASFGPGRLRSDNAGSGHPRRPPSGAHRAAEAAARLFGTSGTPLPLTELRLVPAAAAAWFAAAATIRMPAAAAFLTAGAGTVLLLVLGAVVLLRHSGAERRAAAACVAPLAVVVLVAAVAGTSLLHRTSGPVHDAIAGQTVISGEFRAAGDARPGTPDRFSGEIRYLVSARLESFTLGGKRSTAEAPVLVIGGNAYADIRLGDRFSTSGTLTATQAGDPAAAVLRAGQSPAVIPAEGLYGTASDLRENFTELSKELGPSDASGLLPGMVLGDRAALADDLAAAMKDTGLTHLTAVSGANCSYLLAFVFLAARLLRLPRFWAAAAGLTVLAAFVLVVRPDPSVLRAAVMGSIGTAAVLTGRGKVPAALLCLCTTVLLAIDPWLSGSYAFILSVCATAGLIVLGPRFAASLERVLPPAAGSAHGRAAGSAGCLRTGSHPAAAQCAALFGACQYRSCAGGPDGHHRRHGRCHPGVRPPGPGLPAAVDSRGGRRLGGSGSALLCRRPWCPAAVAARRRGCCPDDGCQRGPGRRHPVARQEPAGGCIR